MSFIQKVNPTGAIGDFLTVWRGAGRSRYILLAAACIPTFCLIFLFYNDMKAKSVPPPPEIIYVESWPADRSMEEILADQAEREKLRQAERERVRENYKALGRAVGMDVERIEREAEAERAAAERAAAQSEAEEGSSGPSAGG